MTEDSKFLNGLREDDENDDWADAPLTAEEEEALKAGARGFQEWGLPDA